MNIIDNVVAYQPQLLPSTEVARFCVYRHKNKINAKAYIGKSYGSSIKDVNNNRWRDGNGYFYSNPTHFSNAIKKYGWDSFSHELLITNVTEAFALKLETLLICVYRELGLSYNSTMGGDGATSIDNPMKNPDVVKRNNGVWQKGHSTWNKGLTKDDPRVAKYCVKHTDEYKKYMSDILTGRTMSSEAIEHMCGPRVGYVIEATELSIHGSVDELTKQFQDIFGEIVTRKKVWDWITHQPNRFPRYVTNRFPDIKVTKYRIRDGNI